MLDHKTYSVGMVKLGELFRKGESLSKLFLATYYQAIEQLTDSQFNRAIDYLIKYHDSHFFPIPNELFKAVAATREQAQITPETNRIEPNYSPCPTEVKKQMQETMERLKKKGIK